MKVQNTTRATQKKSEITASHCFNIFVWAPESEALRPCEQQWRMFRCVQQCHVRPLKQGEHKTKMFSLFYSIKTETFCLQSAAYIVWHRFFASYAPGQVVSPLDKYPKNLLSRMRHNEAVSTVSSCVNLCVWHCHPYILLSSIPLSGKQVPGGALVWWGCVYVCDLPLWKRDTEEIVWIHHFENVLMG
jgi:hypothetical protein